MKKLFKSIGLVKNEDDEVEHLDSDTKLSLKLFNDYEQPKNITCFDYDPIQELLVCGTNEGKIHIIGKETCEQTLFLQPEDLAFEKIFVPENKGVIIGLCRRNDDNYIMVWELSTTSLLYQMKMIRKVELLRVRRSMIMFKYETNENDLTEGEKIYFYNFEKNIFSEFFIEGAKGEKITYFTEKEGDFFVGYDSGNIQVFGVSKIPHVYKASALNSFKGSVKSGVKWIKFLEEKGKQNSKKGEKYLIILYDNGYLTLNRKNDFASVVKVDYFRRNCEGWNLQISSISLYDKNKICISASKKGETKKSEEETRSPLAKKDGDYFGLFTLQFVNNKSCKLSKKFSQNQSIEMVKPLKSQNDKKTRFFGVLYKNGGSLKVLEIEKALDHDTSSFIPMKGITDLVLIDGVKSLDSHYENTKLSHFKGWPLKGGIEVPYNYISKGKSDFLIANTENGIVLYTQNVYAGRKKMFFNIHNPRVHEKGKTLQAHCPFSKDIYCLLLGNNELMFIKLSNNNITRTIVQIYQKELYQPEEVVVIKMLPIPAKQKIVFILKNCGVVVLDLITEKVENRFFVKKKGKGTQGFDIVTACLGSHNEKIQICILANDGRCYVYYLNGEMICDSFKISKPKNIENQKIQYFETISKKGEETRIIPDNIFPSPYIKHSMDLTNSGGMSLKASNDILFINKKNEKNEEGEHKLLENDFIIEMEFHSEGEEKGFGMFSGKFEVNIYEEDILSDLLMKFEFDSRDFKISFFEGEEKLEKKEQVEEKKIEEEKKNEDEKKEKKNSTPKSPKSPKTPTTPTSEKKMPSSITKEQKIQKVDSPQKIQKVESPKKSQDVKIKKLVKLKQVSRRLEKMTEDVSLMGYDKVFIVFIKKTQKIEVYGGHNGKKKVDLLYFLQVSFEKETKKIFDKLSFRNISFMVNRVPSHLQKECCNEEDYLQYFFKKVRIYLTGKLSLAEEGKSVSIHADFFKNYQKDTKYLCFACDKRVKVFKYKRKKKDFRRINKKKFKESIKSFDFGFRLNIPFIGIILDNGSINLFSFPDLKKVLKENYSDMRIKEKPQIIRFSKDGMRVVGVGESSVFNALVLREGQQFSVEKPCFHVKGLNKKRKGKKESESFFQKLTSTFTKKSIKQIDVFLTESFNVDRKSKVEHFEFINSKEERKKKIEDSMKKEMEKINMKIKKEKREELLKEIMEKNNNKRVLMGGSGNTQAVGEMDETMNSVQMAYMKLMQRTEHLQRVLEKTSRLRDVAAKFAETTKNL